MKMLSLRFSLSSLVAFQAVALILLLLVGTASSASCPQPTTNDFFPDKVPALNSQHWSISYHQSYKVITNKVKNEKYLLYHCSTTPPQDANSGKYKVVTKVPLPDGLALTSTVQIPMLELLGLRKEIKTYIGDDQYISSPCLKQLIDNGSTNVFSPGAGGTTMADWSSKNPQRIIIGDAFGTGATSSRTMLEHGHREGGNAEVFEWLYFYAALYNLEKKAKTIAHETADRYNCVAENASKVGGSAPVVVWAYRSYWEGYVGWHVATCNPEDTYYCEYARLCSTTLLHSNEVMTDIQFQKFAQNADFFFYVSTDWTTVYGNHKSILDQIKAVKNKKVYDYQGSGSNSWFEQRLAEYDVVLEDFCTVVGKTTDASPHKRKWFRNVYTEPIGEISQCKDVNAALDTHATRCTRI